jgi:hypothetical protein
MNMGPGFFVIAILGCADGSTNCAPVAMLPTRYESEQACVAAAAPALEANSDFDFPMLFAECRAAKAPAAERKPAPKVPAGARRA